MGLKPYFIHCRMSRRIKHTQMCVLGYNMCLCAQGHPSRVFQLKSSPSVEPFQAMHMKNELILGMVTFDAIIEEQKIAV